MVALLCVACRKEGSAAGRAVPTNSASAPASAAAGTPPPEVDAAARARFDSLANVLLDRFLADDPGWARSLGLHAYDGKVPALDEASLKEARAGLVHAREELAASPVSVLDPDGALDHALLSAHVEQELFQLDEIDVFHKRPAAYDALFGVDSYLTRNYAPLAERLASLVAHEEAALRQVPSIRQNLALPLSRPVVETAIKIFSGRAEYLTKDVPKQAGSFDDPVLQKRFLAANTALAKEARALADWLKRDVLPHADDSHVLGPERYAKLLWAQEGLRTPLAELRAMADADLARNKQAYAALPKGAVRSRPAPDKLLAEATKLMEEAHLFVVEKKIVSLADEERATVKETPPFMRWNSAFLDGPGVFEQASGGFYYITLPDPAWPAKEQKEYVPLSGSLLSTTVHEVYPGHFVQGRWERRAPTRTQKMLGSYSFTEGWAHYVEQMMVEEGFSPSVETSFGQLEDALLRNCRFVVSLGIHTDGMTSKEAERRFREDCYQDAATARQQAARGAFDPGYFAYTLGKIQILELREQVKRKLGPSFSLRAFHDALLAHGSPPVPLLAPRVRRDLHAE